MRLIDADERIELIQKTHCTGCNNYNKVKCRACDIGDMLDCLDEAPTVDQWHYPSKGEYPPDGKDVAIWFDEVPASTSTHFYKWCKGFFNSLTKEWHGDYKGCPCRLTGVKVICWQYVISPKEEE